MALVKDDTAQSIVLAVKRGQPTGVTFDAEVIVGVLTTDYRWTSQLVQDFIGCLRRAAKRRAQAPASKS